MVKQELQDSKNLIKKSNYKKFIQSKIMLLDLNTDILDKSY